jgi:putative ABC transport system permease protein
MLISLLTSLGERRREMSIFRSLGAGPQFIVGVLLFEAFYLSIAGIFVGVILTYGSLALMHPVLYRWVGLHLPLFELNFQDFLSLGFILLGGFVTSIIPAYYAYKNSLADGLTIRL